MVKSNKDRAASRGPWGGRQRHCTGKRDRAEPRQMEGEQLGWHRF